MPCTGAEPRPFVYITRHGKETIQYVDVMSLYPYINKYFKFPVCHPIIHVGIVFKEKEACLHMDGLIKC